MTERLGLYNLSNSNPRMKLISIRAASSGLLTLACSRASSISLVARASHAFTALASLSFVLAANSSSYSARNIGILLNSFLIKFNKALWTACIGGIFGSNICWLIASSNCSFDSYSDGLLTYFSTDSDPKSENLKLDLLRDNIASIRTDISNNSLQLFFNGEKPLSSRLVSLSDWSRNYILSINYLIDHKLLKNTLLLQEILHDFSEISKISNDYKLDENDEALSSYDEISNYVVASSFDIYNESKKGTTNND